MPDRDIVKRIGSAYNLRVKDVIWITHIMVRVTLPDGSEYLLGIHEHACWDTVH